MRKRPIGFAPILLLDHSRKADRLAGVGRELESSAQLKMLKARPHLNRWLYRE
jgi:hypothetical protein